MAVVHLNGHGNCICTSISSVQASHLQQTGLHNKRPAMTQEQAAKAEAVFMYSNV